ncbi:unnamed protein product, partial [Didymodactylos carnosus]
MPLISKLEQLPNEFFYDVFDYLNGYQIFNAFYYLNRRFNFLLENYSYSFKSTTFYEFIYFRNEILPHIKLQQLQVLKVADDEDDRVIDQLNRLLSRKNIKKLTNLQRLHIIPSYTFNEQNLLSTIQKISQLESLTHLTIGTKSYDSLDKIRICELALTLTKLKYLSLTFGDRTKFSLYDHLSPQIYLNEKRSSVE